MKILIPGISGKVGQMLARRLLDDGHVVAGIDKRRWPDAPAGIAHHQVDLRKRAAEEVFRTFKPDTVVHMATVAHFAAGTEERYRINLGGTRAVFDHCTKYGVKNCVFVGRHTYYGAAPDSPLYHTEDEPPLGLASFPELADLVSADLYAGNALWRFPDLTTTVLRYCYTLGASGRGTLATFIKGPLVPNVLGFDPLFQFMSEDDVVESLVCAIDKKPRGVFNVAGPQPVPLSLLVRETGRRLIPLPEMAFRLSSGRFGLPKLPRGALEHIKYSIVIDDKLFRDVTGFDHKVDELEAMYQYRRAFPSG